MSTAAAAQVLPLSARRPRSTVTAVEPGDLLLERALRWEKERAQQIYMVQPMGGGRLREYTWAETVGQARRLAAYFRSLGYPPGSRIALLSKNCAQFIVCDLAIWMAGHISVPLYPTVTADTVRYVLEHSESRALFVGKLDEWPKQEAGVPEGVHMFACDLSPETSHEKMEAIIARTAPLEGQPVRPAGDTATILYTSGSTGVPKGVEIDFTAMAVVIKGLQSIFEFGPEDRMISYLPLAHAFERAAVESSSLVKGFRVYFAESLDTFVADVQRARPTLFHSVPRLWLKFQAGVHQKVPAKKLARLLGIPILGGLVRKKVLRGLGLDQARVAITGSAPVPADLVAWYRRLGLQLVEGYAMSENFCYSHIDRVEDAVAGSVGKPAPDVECKLGPDGEVLVKSPANMIGYYKEPGLTAEAFTPDGFLRTGDRGHVDPDGRLRITGRTKELFKTSKGKYVAPAPIESALQATGLVELACVTGSGLPQPVAVVSIAEALRPNAQHQDGKAALEPELRKLLSTVNAAVAEHEKLDRLFVSTQAWTIDNGLLTPTMKIRRAAIENRYGERANVEGGPELIWVD